MSDPTRVKWRGDRLRIGVVGSLHRLILELCERVGLVLTDARDLDHLSKKTLVFLNDRCLTTVTIEDTELPGNDAKDASPDRCDPTPTSEDWDRARRILVAYGPKLLGCDMTPLALEFARVRSEEREACALACEAVSQSAAGQLASRHGSKPEFLHGVRDGAGRSARKIRSLGAS